MVKHSGFRKTLATAALIGFTSLIPTAFAAPANATTATSVDTKITTSSDYPFGTGKETQNYAYNANISKFTLRVNNANTSTKVLVQKWNWTTEKWDTRQTITTASSTGTGYRNYAISIPKSPEGKTEAYRVFIPSTSSHQSWSSKISYVKTTSRATVGMGSGKPFGSASTVSVNAQPNGMGTYTWGGFSGKSQNFYLQEYKGGKWVKLSTVKKTKATNGTFTLSYSIPIKNGGSTSTYRIDHPATSTVKAWTTNTQKVSYKLGTTDFYEADNTLWAGMNKRWPVNTTQSLSYIQAANGEGRTAYLQRYNSKTKKWHNMSSVKLGKGYYARGTIKVPASKTQGNATYRMHIPKNSYYAADTSKSFTVRYEDPRTYTGFRKSVYTHVKKYCPNVLIDPAKANSQWQGLAYFQQKRFLVVTSGMNAGRFKKVSLHECAHIIQGTVYSDYNQLAKAADKVYGKGKGIEHMADCMAYRMGANPTYWSYTKNCSGARGTAAAKVLSGKKL